MSIQRCPHDKKHPYAIISKDIIFNIELKPRARLLLIALLALPDDWKVFPNDMAARIGYNVDTVYFALQDLQAAGFCRIVEKKNEKGHRMTSEYFISEIPTLNGKTQVRESLVGENTTVLSNEATVQNKDYDESSSSRASSSGKNDDDDACGASKASLSGESLLLTKTNGMKHSVTVSDIVRHFCGKPYSTEILMRAIEKLRQLTTPVNNIYKYVEEICKSIIRDNETNSFNFNKKPLNPILGRNFPVEKKETITMAEFMRRKKCQNDTPSAEKV